LKEKLIRLLESFGFPVFLQGSLEPEIRYPDSFFTFWNNDTYDGSYYNNDTIAFIWSFDINFYSTSPELVNTKLVEVRRLLRDNNFIVSGVGYDVGSDEITHTGRGINALYIEYRRKNDVQ